MSKLSGILFKSLSARVMSSFAKRQWLICFFFTVVSVQFTHSQLFPVQVSPQLTPPYSLKLSDYSTSTTEKLLVNLLLTDVNESDLQVRLRFSISGNSVNIQSKDFVQNAAPIQLTGGIPLRLSNLDLQPYFDLQNLDGITPSEYSKPLPDGLYQFCFEVFDWTTGRPLSEKKCYPVYLVLNDPPFLNLPQNGEQVPARDPQNIIFQWTPRHVNATGVEYEFELRELWDTNVDPQAAFLASPNLYQTTGFANTLLYGPGETSLLEGKTYGWRVRAVVSDGISETAVFKNGGYSEIFYFTYTGKCDAPQYILAKSEGTTTEEITWQQNPDHINYQIQFRKEGGSNNVWFESETVETKKKLFFLEAETTYEYRVGGQCVQNGGYSYSAINTFTTPGKEDASEYNCGIPPEIVITNQDPLQLLGVNDVFTAGDFPVTVKEVNGGNGNYTGWGFIVVPYLGDTQIRVTFNNIKINTDKQLTNGIVETEYDEKFATTGGAGMSDVSELTELIEGDNDIDELNVNFVIPPDYFEDYITVEDGQVVIRNPNDAQVRTSPLGDDKVIVDSAGNTYHVDAEGNVTKGGKIDEGGPVNADNVEGVTKNGDIESLTAKGITVTFNSRGTYGYDKLPSGINNTKLNEEYKSIKDAQGANYEIVNHVAEKNKSSLITATVSISNSDYTIDDLIFKTKQGELLTHTKATNNTVNLSVQGRYTFENEPIYAVVKSKQDTTKQQTAGAFNLWHLSRKTVDVVLVSVNGAQLPTAIELNTIFNQAATTLNIETKSVSLTNGLLGADNKLEIGDKPWLNTYNQEQKAIIADLKQKIDYQKDKYYVFTFNSNFITTKSIAGFMPLKRQFGFVFNGGLDATEEGKEDLAKVTAHEVAHGIFALQHPFTTYGDDIKGKTPWLMDYANGDLLSHMDWAQIHNPNLKFYIFQDEEDGEHVTVSNMEYLDKFKNSDGSYTFISMSGKPISLPDNTSSVTFSIGDDLNLKNCSDEFRIEPFGSIRGFTIQEDTFSFCASCNSSNFSGYFKKGSNCDVNSKYIDSFSNKENVNAIVGLPCIANNNVVFKVMLMEGYFNDFDFSEINGSYNGQGSLMAYDEIINNFDFNRITDENIAYVSATFKPMFDDDVIDFLNSEYCLCSDNNFTDIAYAFIYATQLQKNKNLIGCFTNGVPLFFYDENINTDKFHYAVVNEWKDKNINGFTELKKHVEEFKNLATSYPSSFDGGYKLYNFLKKYTPEQISTSNVNSYKLRFGTTHWETGLVLDKIKNISSSELLNQYDDVFCLWESIPFTDRISAINTLSFKNEPNDKTEEILLYLIINETNVEKMLNNLKLSNYKLFWRVWDVLDFKQRAVLIEYLNTNLITQEKKDTAKKNYDEFIEKCKDVVNGDCDLNKYKLLPIWRANALSVVDFSFDISPGGLKSEFDYSLETSEIDGLINIKANTNYINFNKLDDYWTYFLTSGKELYNSKLGPFRTITLVVREDIKLNGNIILKKDQLATVPAIFLHWLDSSIDSEQNQVIIRVAADGLVVASIIASGGATTPLLAMDLAIFGTDFVFTVVNESSENIDPEVAKAWEAIYNIYNIANIPRAVTSTSALLSNGTKNFLTFVENTKTLNKFSKFVVNPKFLDNYIIKFKKLSNVQKANELKLIDNLIIGVIKTSRFNKTAYVSRSLARNLIDARLQISNSKFTSTNISMGVETSVSAYNPYLKIFRGNQSSSVANVTFVEGSIIKPTISSIRWLPGTTKTESIRTVGSINDVFYNSSNNILKSGDLEVIELISSPGQFYLKPSIIGTSSAGTSSIEVTNFLKLLKEKDLTKLKTTLSNIDDPEKLARFADKFSELPESLVALNNKPKSAEAWFVLDDIGVDDAIKIDLENLDEVSELIGGSYKTWKTSSAGVNNRLWTNIEYTGKYYKVKFLDDVDLGVASSSYTQATKTIEFDLNVPPYLQKQGVASEIYAKGLANHPETKIIKEEYIASSRYIGGEPANLTVFKKLINGTDAIPPVSPKEAAFLTPSGKTIKRNNFDAEPEILINTDNNVTIQFRRASDAADAVDSVIDVSKFKNTLVKTPGIDNSSLTNLPKSFWDDAYKVSPKSGTSIKTKVDNIIANGDQSGKITEGLVEDIMTANGYKVGNGRYYGDYETARNGLDGFFYKGDITNPSEIIVIDSKQFKIDGSVKLNNGNSSTGLPSQMKEDWIRYIADEKLNELKGLQKQTATAIQNSPAGFIQKYVVAVDKGTGEINFLKLGDF